jgi:hypothetical protein
MNMHTPNHVIHSAGAVRYSWLIENFGTVFNFLFTIVIKVLILCTENPKFFIEVLDELELLIDKKVIIEEKKFPSVRRAVYRPPSTVRRHTFFLGKFSF